MPGDSISDTVRMSHIYFDPVEGEVLTWNLNGVLIKSEPVDGACTNVDWTQAQTVLQFTKEVPEEMVKEGSATWSGLGEYTIPHGETAMCYTYGEKLIGSWETIDATEAPLSDHLVGHVQQTTLVSPRITLETGGTIKDTGVNLGLWPLVALLILGVAGVTPQGRRCLHRLGSLVSKG